jgi:hypothetical protein
LKKSGLFFLHLSLVVLLTVLTQIGGLVYLTSLFISARFRLKSLVSFGVFLGIYTISAFLIVPVIAPYFGRVPLPVNSKLKPLTLATCVLNRHYVTPALKNQLVSAAGIMNDKLPGTTVNYLDANFPFFNGFPLLPHLSHNDGKKVDLAFFYKKIGSGEKTNETPSFIGYGAFDGPKEGEVNYPEKCREEGFVMYNALGFLSPVLNSDKFTVDIERTAAFTKLLAGSPQTSKIFIEPHLKQRWGLMGVDKVRFQGCHSVRHDDHIHMQIF